MVIGAGPNGLVAANLLAGGGRTVEVLEAQPAPGGAVRSDRGVHPDHVSDLYSGPRASRGAVALVAKAIDTLVRRSHTPLTSLSSVVATLSARPSSEESRKSGAPVAGLRDAPLHARHPLPSQSRQRTTREK